MSFTSKNLHSTRSGMSFIKGATLFFLGMSCIMFMAKAFDITPSNRNVAQVIQTILLTNDGNYTSSTGVFLNGSGGYGHFAGNVDVDGSISTPTVCLNGNCQSAWPTGGGGSLWSTGSSNSIYYNLGNVGIGSIPLVGRALVVSGVTELHGQTTISDSLTVDQNINAGGDVNVIGKINASCGLPGSGNGIYIANGSYIYDSSCDIGGGRGQTLHIQSDDDIRIQAGSGVGIYVTTGGNVGIGTGNPAVALDVAGTGRFMNDLYIQGMAKIGNGLSLSSDPTYSIIQSANKLQFNTNGFFSRMTIDAVGNVGIGIPNPAEKLEVNGTIKFGETIVGSNVKLGFDLFGSDVGLYTNLNETLANVYSGYYGYGGSYNNAYLKIATGNGNVGIGTQPLYKLDVAGDANFTDLITVSNTGIKMGAYSISAPDGLLPPNCSSSQNGTLRYFRMLDTSSSTYSSILGMCIETSSGTYVRRIIMQR